MKCYYRNTKGFYSIYALICLCFCLIVMQCFIVNLKTYVNLRNSDLLYECYCINEVKKQLDSEELESEYQSIYENIEITYNYSLDKVIISCDKYQDLVIEFDKLHHTIKEVYFN